ncbi:MAG: type II toxin-antitoxin system ParD family antitoxin [Acetobacteraceae bacterium]|nr:type II toxin-antitoxin system ParD family antitoxin [Acetobacteraceae bacterium]
MGKNTSFTLSDHFSQFVAGQIEQGRYGSASDVVRAGLRLLEAEETQLAALRAALIEGEDSGVSDRSVSDIWSTVRERNGLPGE